MVLAPTAVPSKRKRKKIHKFGAHFDLPTGSETDRQQSCLGECMPNIPIKLKPVLEVIAGLGIGLG